MKTIIILSALLLNTFLISLYAQTDVAKTFFEEAEKYRKAGNYDEAISNYESAIGLAPEETKYRFSLASCYARIGLHESTIKTLEGILEIKPDHLPSYQALVKSYATVKNYDKMVETLGRLSEQGKTTEEKLKPHYRIVKFYKERKEYDKALWYIEQAFQVDETDSELLFLKDEITLLKQGIGN